MRKRSSSSPSAGATPPVVRERASARPDTAPGSRLRPGGHACAHHVDGQATIGVWLFTVTRQSCCAPRSWARRTASSRCSPAATGGFARWPRESVVRRPSSVSYTHLRAHETDSYLVCRLLLEKK